MDLDKTLEELEGEEWGRAPFSSYVVTTSHAMRRKRLRDLTDEELRLGIGQRMSLRFLVPVAIERLRSDALVSGDLYCGALLKNLLDAVANVGLPEDQVRFLDEIVERFTELAPDQELSWREECLPPIMNAIEGYRLFSSRKRL